MRESSANMQNKDGGGRIGSKSKERKPLFQRAQNANFFKKNDNETEIFAPREKPPNFN